MTPEVEYLDDALAEAEDAARWYAEFSPAAAAGFASELDAATQAIAEAPNAWPSHVHGTRRFLLRRFPYSVVYRAEPTRLIVIAVAHARRRPGYWSHRMESPR